MDSFHVIFHGLLLMIKQGKNKVTLTMACFFSAPSVFCSMELITLQELRRAPTTFLKATDSKFLSSLESSTPVSVTAFMEAAMSSYLNQICIDSQVPQHFSNTEIKEPQHGSID